MGKDVIAEGNICTVRAKPHVPGLRFLSTGPPRARKGSGFGMEARGLEGKVKVLGQDRISALHQNGGALHHMLQFAHVALPRMAFENARRLLAQMRAASI